MNPATASTTTSTSKMDFRQLQEQTNQWTNELEEQEKKFIEQAVKVNYWDKTLMVNGEKITQLSNGITKIKTEHKKLEENVDKIKSMQRDLEATIEQLEISIPKGRTIIPERASMYARIENVDMQLQQTSKDLKEIIRHINDTNRTVDKSDYVSQILKILNEHTDTLQWLNDNVDTAQECLEDVDRTHRAFRENQEQAIRAIFQKEDDRSFWIDLSTNMCFLYK